MLVKVLDSGSSYQPLSGPYFTVYTDTGLSNIAKGTILNNYGVKQEITLKDLPSGAGGAFFIGEMSYGTYYVVENMVGTLVGTFVITIDKGGVVEIDPNDPTTTRPVKTVELS